MTPRFLLGNPESPSSRCSSSGSVRASAGGTAKGIVTLRDVEARRIEMGRCIHIAEPMVRLTLRRRKMDSNFQFRSTVKHRLVR